MAIDCNRPSTAVFVSCPCSLTQVGTGPKIIIWDTATMQTVKVLKGFHRRAVTLLVSGVAKRPGAHTHTHLGDLFQWKDGMQPCPVIIYPHAVFLYV